MALYESYIDVCSYDCSGWPDSVGVRERGDREYGGGSEMTKRHVEVPPAMQAKIDETVEYVHQQLSKPDTANAVGEILADLYDDADAYERYRSGESLPPMTRMRVASYNPENVLAETEHWAEQELADLRESKYIRYLWEGFDCSPLANNPAFALPFRQALAEHLFADAGEDVRLFGGIKIQCGHNIEMGDNVVVHNDVLLDDRGKLTIGDRVSIADTAHVHTHAHDTVDQTDVTNYETILADDVRLGYGAMISAGCRIGENAMVGSGATTLGDVPAHHITAGSPAKSVKIKPGWEAVAEDVGPLVDNREQRQLPSDVPESIEEFDEFGRTRSPPGES